MNYQYQKEILKTIKKLQPKELKKLSKLIATISDATTLQEIPDIVYLKQSNNKYRIKLGKNYRVIIIIKEEILIIQAIVKRNEDTYRHL